MLRQKIHRNGVIPFRENGQPANFPHRFLLSRMGRSPQLRSQTTAISHISCVENICELLDIDHEQHLAYENGLSAAELSDINRLLHYEDAGIMKLLEQKRNGADVALLLRGGLGELKPASDSTIRQKKTLVREYFHFLMDHGSRCLREHYVCPAELYKKREAARADIERIIVSPKAKKTTGLTSRSYHDILALEAFMENIEQHDDIWKTKHIQLRNEVMFGLQFYGGLRIGEVLNLKIKEVMVRANQIEVVHRNSNQPDPRGAQGGSAKTGSRLVRIPNHFAEKIDEWIGVRGDIEDALIDRKILGRCQDWLIINVQAGKRYGAPTTRENARKAFKQLLKKAGLNAASIDEEAGQVGERRGGSHVLRHLSATRYARALFAEKKDPKQIEQKLRLRFGWSENSEMPFLYTSLESERAVEESLAAREQKRAQRMQDLQRSKDHSSEEITASKKG